jgi:ADP-heptose:LPS heptosyltransferase
VTEGQILVVQLARLGDVVQTWPLLRRLRRQDPGCLPDLLADHSLEALHSWGPAAGRVWGVDLGGLASLGRRDLPEAYDRLRSLAEAVRHRRYEMVYNLNFSRKSLLLSYLAGGEVRGYRPVKGGREFLREPWLALVYALVHNRQVNRVHLSDVFRHLAPPGEPEPRPAAPVLGMGEPLIALQLATRHPKRTWPLAAFTRLAGILVNRLGARLWLVGTKAEAPLGEALAAGLTPAQRERLVNLQGRTDLTELAARLREAQLVISGDTGTLHLAAALGTRTVGVFLGPASCFETGPYGEGHYVFQAEPPCHPCVEAGPACPEPVCQAMITPEAVADLAVSLWEEGEGFVCPAKPHGTRLYRSVFDPLGVRYAALQDRPRFVDLVGQAYRVASARLLGLAWPGDRPPCLGLNEEDWRNLEGLAAALNEGTGLTTAPPALVAALTPLTVYREEMARQRILGRDQNEAEFCLDTVAQGLRAGLRGLGVAQ